MAASYLASLEQDPFWQATAERDGELIVLMRGRKGGPYEKNFYTMNGGIPGYLCLGGWLREQFTTGKFKLLRGSIPTDDND